MNATQTLDTFCGIYTYVLGCVCVWCGVVCVACVGGSIATFLFPSPVSHLSLFVGFLEIISLVNTADGVCWDVPALYTDESLSGNAKGIDLGCAVHYIPRS